jgi:hypothetical protein
LDFSKRHLWLVDAHEKYHFFAALLLLISHMRSINFSTTQLFFLYIFSVNFWIIIKWREERKYLLISFIQISRHTGLFSDFKRELNKFVESCIFPPRGNSLSPSSQICYLKSKRIIKKLNFTLVCRDIWFRFKYTRKRYIFFTIYKSSTQDDAWWMLEGGAKEQDVY